MHPDEGKITFFLAWNVLTSPTWAPGSPNDDGHGLPMAARGGNISPERRIIRWMSVWRVAMLLRSAAISGIHVRVAQ